MVDVTKRNFFYRKKLQDNSARLPWLKHSHDNFTDLCTRCGQCVDNCETEIIVKGDGGFPQIDFSLGECTFCYRCAKSCPEPLFLTQQQTPWNIKAIINESCLAYKNVECRSCGEQCDTMAIQFELSIGQVAQPSIEIGACNGCGACVSACPTSSISVSNAV